MTSSAVLPVFSDAGVFFRWSRCHMTVGGASKPNRTSEILKGQCVGQQRPQAGHRRNSCSSSTIRPTPLTLCHPEKRLLLKFTQVGVLSSSGADHDVITNTLFQLEETKGGAVQIDDVDLSGVGLRELRSGLAIIPKGVGVRGSARC